MVNKNKKIEELEARIKELEQLNSKLISPYKIDAKLFALKGAFDKVPDDIAPSQDKGIYFYKAIDDFKKFMIEIIRLL